MYYPVGTFVLEVYDEDESWTVFCVSDHDAGGWHVGTEVCGNGPVLECDVKLYVNSTRGHYKYTVLTEEEVVAYKLASGR